MLPQFALIFALMLSFNKAHSSNELLILGGGGEPPGSGTIFDDYYSKIMKNSVFQNWKKDSYFDGGHSVSAFNAKALTDGKNKTISTANAQKALADIENQIRQGQIKSGEKIVISIATHGAPPNVNQTSHSVQTTDAFLDLDKLIKVRNLAESKGVHLVILDFSCYSGNSMKLATNKTCVVSAAGLGVGYNVTSEQFATSIKKGRSVEQAFLDMRDNLKNLPSSPQISSPAGKKTFEVTKDLNKSLYTKDLLKSEIDFIQKCNGSKSDSIQRLKKELAQIAKNETSPLFAELKNTLDIYYSKRSTFQEAINRYNRLNENEICITQAKSLENCFYNLESLDLEHDRLEELPILNKNEKETLEAIQKFKKSEKYSPWKKAKKEIFLAPNLDKEAAQVAIAEKKVYTSLYDQYSKSLSKEPNPCKEFVF